MDPPAEGAPSDPRQGPRFKYGTEVGSEVDRDPPPQGTEKPEVMGGGARPAQTVTLDLAMYLIRSGASLVLFVISSAASSTVAPPEIIASISPIVSSLTT